jgi:hypothetical protein
MWKKRFTVKQMIGVLRQAQVHIVSPAVEALLESS